MLEKAKNSKGAYLAMVLAFGGCERQNLFSNVSWKSNTSEISLSLWKRSLVDKFESYVASRCSIVSGECVSDGGPGNTDFIPRSIGEQHIYQVSHNVSKEGTLLISFHNHPVRVVELFIGSNKLQFPDRLLTAPSGRNDCLKNVVEIPLNRDSKLFTTEFVRVNANVVVDPGGIWVCSLKGPSEPLNKNQGKINELRAEMMKATQETSRDLKEIANDFIKSMVGLSKMKIIFLPSGASNREILDAAEEVN